MKTVEDYKNREKNRQLREQLEALQAKMPEGSIVLQREDAALWNQLKGLKEALSYGEGKAESILAMLKEYGDLKDFKTSLQRDTELQKVCDAAGAKLEVLKKLGPDLTYDVKEIEGKKAVYVKYEEGGVTKEMEFRKYAKETWPDFEPALFNTTGDDKKRQPSGPVWIRQNPSPSDGGGGNPKSVVSGFLKTVNAARTGQKEESKA